jgi:dTDP-4-dehydrorhamnose reductase
MTRDAPAARPLVIGASGLVGREIRTQLLASGDAHGTCHRHREDDLAPLDVTDPVALEHLFDRIAPTVVFLCAAAADVDWCAANPDLSFAVNVSGPRSVSELCCRHGTQLVYLSTDYVYDGRDGPYAEEDLPNPVNVYGAHKWIAEREVLDRSPSALVLRTAVVYGARRYPPDPVAGLITALRNGADVRASTQHWTTPTCVHDLGLGAIRLARAGATGVFHLAGPVVCSRYEFAVTVARAAQLGAEALSRIHDGLPPTPRPQRCGLRIAKAQRFISYDPVGYRQGLQALLENAAPDPHSLISRTRPSSPGAAAAAAAD